MIDHKDQPSQQPAEAPQTAPESNAEEQKVREILEKARQSVKALAKDAIAGEEVDTELLNFRMRRAE